MLQSHTINPYYPLAGQLAPGLDAIIAALPLAPTHEDLIKEVVAYVASVFSPNPHIQVQIEMTAVAAHSINSYCNNLVLDDLALYNEVQMPFIEMLIGAHMTSYASPDSFVSRTVNIEDNLGVSQLTVHEQIPLFLAAATGIPASAYWNNEINKAGSAWAAYFSTNDGQNYMNTLHWNVAAMNGALSGYGASISGLIEPSTNRVTNQIMSALIGALTVTAGKVIFNWVPRITKPFNPYPDVPTAARPHYFIRRTHKPVIVKTPQ